jgi:hypothetical protein
VTRQWTAAEIEKLVKWTLEGVGPHELARRLRRCGRKVREMQIELELIDASKLVRRWTEEELDEIRRLYADTPTEQLAKHFGRPVHSIYNAATRLGIVKSDAFMASPAACRLRRGDEIGKAFRFKPGIVPHNKGVRMPGFRPGRMGETQFQKGSLPRNNMPLGSTRLMDGYLYRKTSEISHVAYTRNWTLEHYLIWQHVNGPLPPGHVLVFKDGDRTHIELGNLELITRGELARRNTIHNLPEELKEVIRLNASIKRRIRKMVRADEKQDEGSAESPLRDARSA